MKNEMKYYLTNKFENMKTKNFKILTSTIVGGLSMWILAGLWHNLILPTVNKNIHAHHEGIGILLIAYFILAFFMTYVYTLINKKNKPVLEGLKIGILIGIIWVFPHGLAMAGTHDTSILYEIKNTIWHIFEQGVGGIIMAAFLKNIKS